MIISFGAILMHSAIHVPDAVPDSAYEDAARYADQYSMGIGGKAALQALAAANAGAKIALISKIGDDHYGKNMLLKLRQRGVITSGVARKNSVSTGTCFDIGGKTNDRILALGASQWVSHEQAPEEILKPETIVMFQTEIPMKDTRILLSKAKEQGATTIMNLSPQSDLSPEDMKKIDFLIIPQAYKPYVADAGKYENLSLIILNSDGSLIVMKNGQIAAEIPKPAGDTFSYKYPAGAEDAFCGTFAAMLYARTPLSKALKMANIARALTASKPGQARTLPYIDDVKKAYEDSAG